MTKPKIAIFHHFLLSHCKGGGENLMLQTRDHFDCPFWTGAVDLEAWDNVHTKDSFTELLNKNEWHYLLEESHVFGWKYIKRQWAFLFSPKVKELAQNDIVIFSFGNIAFVPQRVKKYNPNCRTIAYIHTPPRVYTDQNAAVLANMSWYKKPLFKIFTKLVLWNFNNAVNSCDHIIANSENIKGRLKKFCNVEANSVIFPLVDTANFKNLPSQDFYLSHARLEPLKRIDLIVKAFEKMPDKKLVITSGGPMKQWVEDYIKNNNIKNIEFKGRVTDEVRDNLMSTCMAGIYIPVDEDAGITQLEFMACGKPIIGVKDGGLIESIIDGKTGILMSKEPTIEELIEVINSTPKVQLEAMKDDCMTQALKFDKSVYFRKFDEVVSIVQNP
jgi:glycosyltransferase involved in cell wall biosynthesis